MTPSDLGVLDPFWEPDYPSQRFRPKESSDENRTYSGTLQYSFSSVSVNEICVDDNPVSDFTVISEHSTSPLRIALQMNPTSFTPAHRGPEDCHSQNQLLTSYGICIDTSKFADAAHGGVHTVMTPCLQQKTEESHSEESDAVSATDLTSFKESTEKSELGVCPSSGVPLTTADINTINMTSKQRKTFQQLEEEKGVREWSSSKFDERWMKHNESTMSGCKEGHRSANSDESADKIRGFCHQSVPELQGHPHEMKDTQTKFGPILVAHGPGQPSLGYMNENPQYVKSLQGNQSTTDLVREPSELQNLKNLISRLKAGTEYLPHGICTRSDLLRRHFYKCVFNGKWDGPISGPEGDNMTQYQGKFVSLKVIRDKVLTEVEDLIASINIPAGKSIYPNVDYDSLEPTKEDASRGNAPMGETLSRFLREISPQGHQHPVENKQPSTHDSGPVVDQNKPAGAQESEKVLANDNTSHKDSHISDKDSRQPLIEKPKPTETCQEAPAVNDSKEKEHSLSLDALAAHALLALAANNPKQHPLGTAETTVKGELPQKVTSETSTLKHKRKDPSDTAANHNRSPLQKDKSSAQMLQSSFVEKETEEAEHKQAEMFQQPMPYGGKQINLDTTFPRYLQHNTPAFGHQLPQQHQHFPMGAMPTSMFGYQAPWNMLPFMHQGYGYHQPFGNIYTPQYGFPSQPLRSSYGTVYPPLSAGPPPQPSAYELWHREFLLHGLDAGPPPPGTSLNMGVRPAASNRLAGTAYRTNPVPQTYPLPQVRGTPAPLSFNGRFTASASGQNQHQWQNRVGTASNIKPDIPVLPYRPGSDDMRPHAPAGAHSNQYQQLTKGFVPTFEEARAPENVPFTEAARDAKPPSWGVLKIGNIPYDLTKNLVTNFLGHHAKLISPSFGPAIHIIMDRNSGKTMDCFVEFLSTPDARACCNSINLRLHSLNRISDRMVDVKMSNQDDLLATLFPKAKNVEWKNGHPIIKETEDEWSSGFKNFISTEELGLMVRHAEQPHRSNYTARSPERPYEAMISLLAKFPWYSVENYKVSHRNQIFNAVRQMMHILCFNIRKGYANVPPHLAESTTDPLHSTLAHPSNMAIRRRSLRGSDTPMLNEQLMQDLLSAALNAAGFSESQRWELYQIGDFVRQHFLVSPLLQHWPFHVLCRKSGVDEDVVEAYAHWVSHNPEVKPTGNKFGDMYNLYCNVDLEGNTMDAIGTMEQKLVDALLLTGLEYAREDALRDEAVKSFIF